MNKVIQVLHASDPDEGEDMFQCLDCGGLGPSPDAINHVTTCKSGEAAYWEKYYEEAAKEEIMEELKDKFTDWVKHFSEAKVNQMPKDLTRVFMSMVMAENRNIAIPSNLLDHDFLYQVVNKRADFIKLRLSDCVKIFLASLIKSPGESTMFLYYLRAKQIETDNKEFSMLGLTNLFPKGFPTDAALEKLWREQKTEDHKNMLDLITFSGEEEEKHES